MAGFTDIFGFIKQETAENQLIWGSALASSFIDLVDEGIAGLEIIDVTAGGVTLTDDVGVTNQARNMILRFTGAPVLPLTVIVPDRAKLYAIDNQCGQVVTVKTTVATGIDVADGEIVSAVVDSTTGFVFKMALHPDEVVLTGPATLTAVSASIFGSDPTGQALTVFFFQEGDGVFNWGWEEFSYLNSAAVSLLIQPDSSFPAPTRQQGFPTYTEEPALGGTIFECSIFLSAGGIFVSHSDGSGITPSVQIDVSSSLMQSGSNAPG